MRLRGREGREPKLTREDHRETSKLVGGSLKSKKGGGKCSMEKEGKPWEDGVDVRSGHIGGNEITSPSC